MKNMFRIERPKVIPLYKKNIGKGGVMKSSQIDRQRIVRPEQIQLITNAP